MRWVNSILILMFVAALGAAMLELKEAAVLRRANEELRAECQALREQVATANAKQNSLNATEAEQQKKNLEELLRLRSEATKLRAKAAEATKLRAENQQLRAAIPTVNGAQNSLANSTNAASGENHPRDSWAFSGYATPEATLVSAIWAMREGNPRAYLDSLSPDEQARQSKQWENKSESDVAAKHQQDVSSITGFQVLSTQNISPDEVQMNVFVAGPDQTRTVSLVRNGGDWKFAGFVQPPK